MDLICLFPLTIEPGLAKRVENQGRKTGITRAPFPARAPPPPRSVTQLEEDMMDLKLYDACLFWAKTGAVNLKPEGNSWDDDMVIQSKDPAWVRNAVDPPNPSNQELLILPSVAKIERSIEVFFEVSLAVFLCLFSILSHCLLGTCSRTNTRSSFHSMLFLRHLLMLLTMGR